MSIFEGKDILVTGGCGSIGSEIVRQLVGYEPRRIRVLDNNESGHWNLSQEIKSDRIRNLIGDVRDLERVRRAMDGVDIVFHAAALKHVPLCEYNPFEAVHTNVIGTRNVVTASYECNVDRMISISTDKAVNPINTMGATKLLGEKIVVNAPSGLQPVKYCCVRFGNVLGSVGSVIPMFTQQIQQGGPVTVTTADMTRFFMTIPQSVTLVLKAAEHMLGHEIFVLKMNIVRIIDLAEVMIEELAPKFGFRPQDIPITFIGKRPGEKTHEYLFTEEEAPYIEEHEDMLIVRNSPYDPRLKQNPDYERILKDGQGRIIDREEIRKVLRDNGYV
jgi:UDP-N-acetylglucosamine 4,6-dehydratase